MHSVLEGVIKRLFKAWFEENHDPNLPYKSLKNQMAEISIRFMKIRPPSFIPVVPRDLYSWRIWRAKEFLIFLIYYCLPVFNQIMEASYYEHLTQLVVCMEYLLAEKISRNGLDDINSMLSNFVEECPKFYGDSILLSGTHELLHLVKCTKEFGPINVVNSFQFEENNRGILKLIHGTDLVGDEFLKVFSVSQALHTFVDNFVQNQQLKNFIQK
jgi:hypothetical protein